MKETINLNDFRDYFARVGRRNQFSYKGLEALFNYLKNLKKGMDKEPDVIAICCEFTEYENLEAFNNDYENFTSIEDIEDYTTVIMIDDDSFIIRNF